MRRYADVREGVVLAPPLVIAAVSPIPCPSPFSYEGIGFLFNVGVRRLSIVAALLDLVDAELTSLWLLVRRDDGTLGEVGGGGLPERVLARLEERDRAASRGDDKPDLEPNLGVVDGPAADIRVGVGLLGEELAGEVMDLVIRCLSGVVYVEETARGVPCCKEGEPGTGLDTILGDPTCSDDTADSAAFAALLFSASRADMVVDLLAGTGLLGAIISCTTIPPGLIFSSCFLAIPSRPSMMLLPLPGHRPANDQKPALANSLTPGLTSIMPRLTVPSSISSKSGVVSMDDLVLGP